MTIANESLRIANVLPQFWADKYPDLTLELIDKMKQGNDHDRPLSGTITPRGDGKMDFMFRIHLPATEIMTQPFQALLHTINQQRGDAVLANIGVDTYSYCFNVRHENMRAFADLCEDLVRSRPTLPHTDRTLAGRVTEANAQAQAVGA